MSWKAFSYARPFFLLSLCLHLPINQASLAQALPERPPFPDSVASTEVEITPLAGLDVSHAELVFTLHPGTEHEKTERQPLSLPFRMIFHGGVGAVMRLTVEAEGVWSAPVLLFQEGTRLERTQIYLYPAGEITGRLVLPQGEEAPPSVEVQVESAAADESDSASANAPIIPVTHLTCPVSRDGRFRCSVPASNLDLCLRTDGFVSHYLRNVTVSEGSSTDANDLGELVLERSDSRIGRHSFLMPRGSLEP